MGGKVLVGSGGQVGGCRVVRFWWGWVLGHYIDLK